MAVTEQRTLFNPQIEALTEKYATAMGKRAATPFTEAQIGLNGTKRLWTQQDYNKKQLI